MAGRSKRSRAAKASYLRRVRSQEKEKEGDITVVSDPKEDAPENINTPGKKKYREEPPEEIEIDSTSEDDSESEEEGEGGSGSESEEEESSEESEDEEMQSDEEITPPPRKRRTRETETGRGEEKVAAGTTGSRLVKKKKSKKEKNRKKKKRREARKEAEEAEKEEQERGTVRGEHLLHRRRVFDSVRGKDSPPVRFQLSSRWSVYSDVAVTTRAGGDESFDVVTIERSPNVSMNRSNSHKTAPKPVSNTRKKIKKNQPQRGSNLNRYLIFQYKMSFPINALAIIYRLMHAMVNTYRETKKPSLDMLDEIKVNGQRGGHFYNWDLLPRGGYTNDVLEGDVYEVCYNVFDFFGFLTPFPLRSRLVGPPTEGHKVMLTVMAPKPHQTHLTRHHTFWPSSFAVASTDPRRRSNGCNAKKRR
jgi:hypothetical protein